MRCRDGGGATTRTRRRGRADAALSYGHGLCEKVSRGRPYAQIIADVKADFDTRDQYQASYLLSQAVNELCPALIWQLRNSAVDNRRSG